MDIQELLTRLGSEAVQNALSDYLFSSYTRDEACRVHQVGHTAFQNGLEFLRRELKDDD